MADVEAEQYAPLGSGKLELLLIRPMRGAGFHAVAASTPRARRPATTAHCMESASKYRRTATHLDSPAPARWAAERRSYSASSAAISASIASRFAW